MSGTRVASLTLLALAALAAGGTPLCADDLTDALAALAKAVDPDARRAQVPTLVRIGSDGAARALGRLLDRDPDVRVRAAAADGLGRFQRRVALDLLLDRARAGGTRAVREAVGRALATNREAGPLLVEAVAGPKTSEAERALLLGTLAWFRDEATRRALVAAGRGPPSAARDAAWRALGRRADAPEERRLEMIRLLAASRDDVSALAALDAFAPAAHPDLRPMVERHAASTEPAVRSAAEHFLLRIRATEPADAAPPAKGPDPAPGPGERYAPPQGARDPAEPAPVEAPPLPRYDVVYVLDVTGSTVSSLPGLKKRMLDEIGLLAGLGASLRVGVVAYRDGPTGTDVPSLEVLPLTFDRARFTAFVSALKARGVDSRGAAVAAGLREALDGADWRWDALRHVQLFADTGCDDARAAEATVRLHFRNDGTRTRVAYVLRSRDGVPPELADLALAGGTDAPERIVEREPRPRGGPVR